MGGKEKLEQVEQIINDVTGRLFELLGHDFDLTLHIHDTFNPTREIIKTEYDRTADELGYEFKVYQDCAALSKSLYPYGYKLGCPQWSIYIFTPQNRFGRRHDQAEAGD